MSDYKSNDVFDYLDTLFRTSVRCDICDEEFENDGHNICPKCREAIVNDYTAKWEQFDEYYKKAFTKIGEDIQM